MDENKRGGNCKHAPGVECFVEVKPCGKCGWNPKVSARRLVKIKEKRADALRNGKG